MMVENTCMQSYKLERAYFYCCKVVTCYIFCSLSKITKCQSTLRTSWKKKVEERGRKKSIKDFEISLKEEKKKKLEVITKLFLLFFP